VRRGHRHWQDKAAGQQQAVCANRRRIRGQRGRRLGRWRRERAERSFAHVCETGGGRRTWLRGIVNVSKSYLGRVAAHNLGLLMLALFGIGIPRSLWAGIGLFFALLVVVWCARRFRNWVQDVSAPFSAGGTVQPSASPSGWLAIAT
jgi:hypothetical protein